jgi:hypothetical protein
MVIPRMVKNGVRDMAFKHFRPQERVQVPFSLVILIV